MPCKHQLVEEGKVFCTCTEVINKLNWRWLTKAGKLEVPCVLEFEVPFRHTPRYVEFGCNECTHFLDDSTVN